MINKNNERYERKKKSSLVNLSIEAKKCIATLTDSFPDNTESIEYFYDVASAFSNGNKINTKGKKVIATMCVQVPLELLLAADAYPVRMCSGYYTADQVGAEFLPAKACSLVKASLGMMYLEIFPTDTKPSLIVNTATCDQKRKLGEVSADLVKTPFYTLDLPSSKDSEEARIYWQRTVKRFTKYLEKVTGKKITRNKLKRSIKKITEAQKEYRKFYNLRKGSPVIWGKDAILVTNTYFYDDIDRWTEQLKKLNIELEQKFKNEEFITNGKTQRILLTGSPAIFPNMKVPLIIESHGGVVVAEEFCSTSRLLYDTVAVDEWFMYDMIPALADRYLKPCTCPNFTPNESRQRRIREMVKEFSIDGVVYQSFAGCQLFDLESRITNKTLDKIGIPMLNIETDYSPDDEGQITTRVEAFIDSLKSRKKQRVD